jgi:hypothetical protein
MGQSHDDRRGNVVNPGTSRNSHAIPSGTFRHAGWFGELIDSMMKRMPALKTRVRKKE